MPLDDIYVTILKRLCHISIDNKPTGTSGNSLSGKRSYFCRKPKDEQKLLVGKQVSKNEQKQNVPSFSSQKTSHATRLDMLGGVVSKTNENKKIKQDENKNFCINVIGPCVCSKCYCNRNSKNECRYHR